MHLDKHLCQCCVVFTLPATQSQLPPQHAVCTILAGPMLALRYLGCFLGDATRLLLRHNLRERGGEDGCQAVADSLLVFVPHKTLHGTISILIQRPKLATNVGKMGAVKNKMPWSRTKCSGGDAGGRQV